MLQAAALGRQKQVCFCTRLGCLLGSPDEWGMAHYQAKAWTPWLMLVELSQ